MLYNNNNKTMFQSRSILIPAKEFMTVSIDDYNLLKKNKLALFF